MGVPVPSIEFFTWSTEKVVEVRRVLSKGGVRLVEYTAKSP
jgi:hypothetical protein